MMKRNLTVIVLLLATAAASAQAAGDANSADANAPATKPAAPATRPSQPAGVVPGSLGGIIIPRELTAEQEKEVLEYAKEKRPEEYRRLLEYKNKNVKQQYQASLRSLWYWVEQLKRLPPAVRDRQEVLVGSYGKTWQLARDIAKTKAPATRERMEQELYDLTAQRFEAEQVIREYRIQQILQQVEVLREELKRRAANQDQVIREQMEQMLQNAARMAEAAAAKAASSQPAPTSQPAGSGASPAPHAPVGTDTRN